MSDYTLAIPDDIVQRAQRMAEQTSQSVEQVLIEHLHTSFDVIPPLEPDEEAELYALKFLSIDALETIARETMPQNIQARMQTLMDKNTLGTITTDEYDELAALVERGQRLALRKSEATVLLAQRKHANE